MNKAEFNEQYNTPVNLLSAEAALIRFIDSRGRLGIPASPNDDDMLIGRTIRELGEMRIPLAKVKATGSELLLQYENIYVGENELSKEVSLVLQSI
ncbi:hypothetical protein [Paenibacillus sp. FSL H3-0286]|uniref:hypothetical protein n=1 Tax=Paenibacillus sp. FSL H3-0286 TaxID=2921427 RepID=UPI00324CD48E